MTSTLIICGNHLGNIQDLPPRTVESLQRADIVYAEDTRTARRLLKQLGLKATLLSYYDGNEKKRVEELRSRLNNTKQTIVLLSESGMPLISDPGYRIVNLFHEYELNIEIVPGPTAFVSALVMSGFPLQQFKFIGFWPRKKGQQEQMIEDIKQQRIPFVYYESPKRIIKNLETLAHKLPSVAVFIIKEISKPYETYWRGGIFDVLDKMSQATIKGEFVVVVHSEKR